MSETLDLYSNFPLAMLKGDIGDLESAVLKVCLLQTGYAFDQENHTEYADLTNECPASGGYSTGGATLANVAVTEAARVTKVDADDLTWAASTITAHYAVVYDSTSGLLIAFADFGASISSTAGDFKITWDAAGICDFTVPA